jgi:hypothetical protein
MTPGRLPRRPARARDTAQTDGMRAIAPLADAVHHAGLPRPRHRSGPATAPASPWCPARPAISSSTPPVRCSSPPPGHHAADGRRRHAGRHPGDGPAARGCPPHRDRPLADAGGAAGRRRLRAAAMPYLVADDLPAEPAGLRFRRLVERPASPACPARTTAWRPCRRRPRVRGPLSLRRRDDGLHGPARPRHHHGRRGLFFIRQIARAAGLPLLVDGDTGYGEALNVMHMVRSLRGCRRRCRAYRGPAAAEEVRPPQRQEAGRRRDMAAKVAAARKARRHLYIIARTDAAASEGMDGAWPARLYLEAGADAIFPEALTSAEMFRAFAAHARRAAARQHDRIRPHPVLHRRRVRGHGLPHGDLAGLAPARRQPARPSSMPPSPATAAPTPC